jgi:two-component system osmolarity sensor histidine kinase EnvZ
MTQLRLWPQRLVGQVSLVLMLAVLLEFVGSSILFERSDLYINRSQQARHLAEQLVVTDGLLDDLPPKARPGRARALSTSRIGLSWSQIPTAPPGQDRPADRRLRQQLQTWEPSLRDRELRIVRRPERAAFGGAKLKVALRMRDHSWLMLQTQVRAAPWTMVLGGVGSAFILALGVLVASILVVRNLSAPLRALASAANAVGQGAPVRIAEEGAGDLKLVAHAFNAMQARIADLISARTQALAAVGHDLRTPLSRLRLRASFIGDKAAREAMESDVDEMTAMLDSLLAYLGGDEDPEPRRLVDLAAMVMTLADAATDAGHQASYAGPERLLVEVRPLSMKRALSNVLQNAILYGGRGDISLQRDDDQVVVAVEDDGPGIAEADMAQVLEPFSRLDSARARNTSGLGLGLTIVQRIVAREDGVLAFHNRPQGGLRVEIQLPSA